MGVNILNQQKTAVVKLTSSQPVKIPREFAVTAKLIKLHRISYLQLKDFVGLTSHGFDRQTDNGFIIAVKLYVKFIKRGIAL